MPRVKQEGEPTNAKQRIKDLKSALKSQKDGLPRTLLERGLAEAYVEYPQWSLRIFIINIISIHINNTQYNCTVNWNYSFVFLRTVTRCKI